MSFPSPTGQHLFGRERELAILRQRLETAMSGHGGLALISGEAGIGKTALAETVCSEAVERGALVLTGRSFDLAESAPYGAWIDLFAHYHPTGDLPPIPTPFTERGTVGAVASQTALFHAVLDFLMALAAQHPVVVLLEDAHWQDAASLDLLRFLAREIAAIPILLLATYRSDELTRRDPLYQLLPMLEREARAVRIDLRRLSTDAVHTLVAARYPLPNADTDRLVTWLDERAGGNAFFTLQLLRALEDESVLHRDGDEWRLGELTGVRLPVAVRQVIDRRLLRLDEETQRLLAIAAVIGQDISFDVWTMVTEADETVLLDAVESAATAHLVEPTPEGTGFHFAHALIREALYESILPLRRRVLHRAVAEALSAMPNPDPDAVAFHFQRAGDVRAAEWLIRAGERAQAAYAWVTAATRYEAALALMERRGDPADERGWLLLTIARLRRFTDPTGTPRALEEVLNLARQSGDAGLAAIARFERGLALCFAGRRREGVGELRAGADVLDALVPADRARVAARTGRTEASLRALRGVWMMHAADVGQFAGVLAYAERWAAMEAPTHASAYQGSGYADGWFGLGVAWATMGRVAEAEAAFARAAKTYRAIGHHFLVCANAVYMLRDIALPYWPDRPGECDRWAREAVAGGQRAAGAMEWLLPLLDFVYAPLDFLHGRWDTPSFASLHDIVTMRPDTTGVKLLARRERERGETERAWEWVRAGLPDRAATEPGDCDLRDGLELQAVAVALSLDAGDMERAKEWLAAHDRWLAWSGAVLGQSEGQALWARYHRQAGDLETAREHAEQALAHATEPRQPLALLAAHRLLGELDTEAGQYEDARSHLEAALAIADACQAPYERALTLLAQAELRAATDERDKATRLLDEVRAICEPLSAKPALARADTLAARFDAVPAAAPTYPAGLSAREVEVLRLVAQGLTNAQVAEHLFLGHRTVETHLRSIYNKLGVSTRAAATHFAITHGIA